MIKTFADKKTHELYRTARSRRFPPGVIKRAVRKLEHLNAAPMLDHLKIPPGNRLHDLGDDPAGQHSISINDQWRICFRWDAGNAYDVEIVDYHLP